MFLDRWLKPRPAVAAGRKLYGAVAGQARTPALYAALKAPDTMEGRFELYTLHVLLVLERLKGQGELATETGQALFDAYLRGLDDAFRELGVSYVSVPKKMKKLGEAFYGRVGSYGEALAALPDRAPLESLLARTVFEGAEGGDVPGMADYVLRTREILKTQPLESLLAGEPSWEAAA